MTLFHGHSLNFSRAPAYVDCDVHWYITCAAAQADYGHNEVKRELMGDDGTMSQLELLEQLGQNLKREHTLRILLNCFFWGRVSVPLAASLWLLDCIHRVPLVLASADGIARNTVSWC